MRARRFLVLVLALVLGVLAVPAFAGSAGAAPDDPTTALGRVFMPNPVVTLPDQTLTTGRTVTTRRWPAPITAPRFPGTNLCTGPRYLIHRCIVC